MPTKEFILEPLPFDYDALEPYIDTETVEIHHNRHQQAYVDNLNKALRPYPDLTEWSLEKLLTNESMLPVLIKEQVHNNAGGVYNHQLYWETMYPYMPPAGQILNAIRLHFGSFEHFKDEFKKAALKVFGSGYLWLTKDSGGNIRLMPTANQDTVLPLKQIPLMLIDVWEHAYYLKNQWRRNDYIDNWFNVINWNKVNDKYMQ